MMKYRVFYLLAALSAMTMSVHAQDVQEAEEPTDSIKPAEDHEPNVIYVLGKGYDDRAVLRWAPSAYAPFRVLRDSGYVVTRLGGNRSSDNDTLAVVRALTVDQFKKKFSAKDSLAAVAAQLMWGKLTPADQTQAEPGSFAAFQEQWEQQEDVTGMAMMIAELRPDLAEAMGLMYVDRNVEKGASYIYAVHPNLKNDSITEVLGGSTVVTIAKSAKKSMADIELTDSVTPPMTVGIVWPQQTQFSAYDIERRELSPTPSDWQKVNNRPFVAFKNAFAGDGADNVYYDFVDHLGVYEYRVSGYDTFGELSEPTPPHRVEVKDIVPPVAPLITRFEMNFKTDSHILCNIVFEKSTIEDDLVGYRPLYRVEEIDTVYWKPMTDDLIAPNETHVLIDVSNYTTGHVAMAAYDRAGNEDMSPPMLMRIEDRVPPTTPQNLRANVAPDGLLVLRWSPSPEADVHHYDVFRANDEREVFVKLSTLQQVDTLFLDSLTLGHNQAYVYYKVAAVDGSGNSSKPSKALRVVRPNYIPPQTCRIDTLSVTDDEIYMRWIQSNEDDLMLHRLYRKLNNADQWEVITVYDADSVRQRRNYIEVHDRPPYHQSERWVYAFETVNLTGVTSGLSMPQTFLFTGPALLPVDIRLTASFENGRTRLAWETGTMKPEWATTTIASIAREPTTRTSSS